jgi:hypothetical protein
MWRTCQKWLRQCRSHERTLSWCLQLHWSTRYHLSTTPTADKIIKVILSLPHNKMPGESQITA